MKDNLNALLRVRALANGDAALYFYGEIVSAWWESWDNADKWPDGVRQALDKLTGQPLHIYINSPGGSVFAGMAIYNMLCRYKGRKIVHIDGIAASIASVIAFAGDEIIMPENAMLMVHRAWTVAQGNTEELSRYAGMLEKVDEAIMSVYVGRLRDSSRADYMKYLVDTETYLGAADAAQLFSGVSVAPALEVAAKVKDAGKIYAASVEYERLRLLKLKNTGG